VKTSLIRTRKIIFTPAQELRNEPSAAAIQITCYDRNGEEVKRVTSTDPGTVEDPVDNGDTTGEETGGGTNNTQGGGSDNTSSDEGGKPNQGGNEEP
jgi:hypothetical protein